MIIRKQRGSDVAVITSGIPRKARHGEKNLAENVDRGQMPAIVKGVCENILKPFTQRLVLIIVSIPMDLTMDPIWH
jgi:malate/lactate dehydrogenase